MFQEAGMATRRGAKKGTRLAVQTRIGSIRTRCQVSPLADLIRSKPHAPSLAAVPKSRHLDGLAQRRSEIYRERGLLDGIRISGGTFEGLFEAVPFGHQRSSCGLWRLAAEQKCANEN